MAAGGFNLGSVFATIRLESKEFNQGIKNAKKGIADFKNNAEANLTKIRNASAVVTGAITAVGVASIKLAEQSGKYGAIRNAFESMTEGMIENVDDFEDRVNKATKGTVSNYDILANANRALALIGKDSFDNFGDDFTKMAEFSRKAAMATGESVDSMFDSLVRGVGRASPLILDNLGIQVRAEEVNTAYAESIGKTADQLTSQEEKTALLNAAMTQLEEKYGSAQEPAINFNETMQQLRTRLANASADAGDKLAPALQKMTDVIVPIVEEWLPKIIDLIGKVADWFTNLSPPMQKTILAFIALAPVILIATSLILSLIPVIGALLSPIGLVILAIIAFATVVAVNFNEIKAQVQALWELIKMKFNQGVETLRSIGNRILDAIMWPFNEAKKRIEEAVNWIKDKLDFTKRHSPSVLDIVNMGVKKVNQALEGLNVDVNSNHAGIAGAASPATTSIANVNVDLAGAVIGDMSQAGEIAEKIGDTIVKQLQHNVRI